jgi:glycosyltransferase involved in cell wall biosynthesis
MIIIISVIKSLSLIIPALNEEESIPNLLMDISQVFEKIDCVYEVIIIDDNSAKRLSDFVPEMENLTILRNNIKKGQFASTMKGIKSSKYDHVCLLDGDGQNPPYEIPKLIELYNSNYSEIDVASGIRDNRQDRFVRKTYSKFANFLIRKITNTKSLDIGCSLKIFKKNLLDDLNVSGDVHRILLPLFEKRGFNIIQTKVDHKKRMFGNTNYSFARIVPIAIDSILIAITSGFTKTPRYVLGKISVTFLTFSFLTFSISLYQKYFLGVFVHKNPLFLLGLASTFISVQIFLSIIMMSFIEKQEN